MLEITEFNVESKEGIHFVCVFLTNMYYLNYEFIYIHCIVAPKKKDESGMRKWIPDFF